MPTREDDTLCQIQAQAKEHFYSINIKMTAEQEATLRMVFWRATKPELLGKFEENYLVARNEIFDALAGYRVNAYFADFKCIGYTRKRYEREVKKLANAFGRLAGLLEEVTYFQLDALSNYHEELFSDGKGNMHSMEAKLRMIESHLNSRSGLRPKCVTTKSDCLDYLLQKVGSIYREITGRNDGYSQGKINEDSVEDVKTRDSAFTGTFVDIATLILEVIGERRSNIGLGNKVKRARKKRNSPD